MEYIDHQKGNFVRDDNGKVKWQPDENGQFTMINEPGFRRIDPTPPIEERNSFMETRMTQEEFGTRFLSTMSDNEVEGFSRWGSKTGRRLAKAELKKRRRDSRFVRWFKGIFSYLRIDWRAGK